MNIVSVLPRRLLMQSKELIYFLDKKILLYVQEVVTHILYSTYFINWVTTSWTYSIDEKKYIRREFFLLLNDFKIIRKNRTVKNWRKISNLISVKCQTPADISCETTQGKIVVFNLHFYSCFFFIQ